MGRKGEKKGGRKGGREAKITDDLLGNANSSGYREKSLRGRSVWRRRKRKGGKRGENVQCGPSGLLDLFSLLLVLSWRGISFGIELGRGGGGGKEGGGGKKKEKERGKDMTNLLSL